VARWRHLQPVSLVKHLSTQESGTCAASDIFLSLQSNGARGWARGWARGPYTHAN